MAVAKRYLLEVVVEVVDDDYFFETEVYSDDTDDYDTTTDHASFDLHVPHCVKETLLTAWSSSVSLDKCEVTTVSVREV